MCAARTSCSVEKVVNNRHFFNILFGVTSVFVYIRLCKSWLQMNHFKSALHAAIMKNGGRMKTCIAVGLVLAIGCSFSSCKSQRTDTYNPYVDYTVAGSVACALYDVDAVLVCDGVQIGESYNNGLFISKLSEYSVSLRCDVSIDGRAVRCILPEVTVNERAYDAVFDEETTGEIFLNDVSGNAEKYPVTVFVHGYMKDALLADDNKTVTPSCRVGEPYQPSYDLRIRIDCRLADGRTLNLDISR